MFAGGTGTEVPQRVQGAAEGGHEVGDADVVADRSGALGSDQEMVDLFVESGDICCERRPDLDSGACQRVDEVRLHGRVLDNLVQRSEEGCCRVFGIPQRPSPIDQMPDSLTHDGFEE